MNIKSFLASCSIGAMVLTVAVDLRAESLAVMTEPPMLQASIAVLDYLEFGSDGDLSTFGVEVDFADGVFPAGFTSLGFGFGFSLAAPTTDVTGGFDISDQTGLFLSGDLIAVGFAENVLELQFNNLSGAGRASFRSSALIEVSFVDQLGPNPFDSFVDGESYSASLTVSNVAGEPGAAAFELESFEVTGNLPGAELDEFGDGVLSPWVEEDPTATESGGRVTFSPSGSAEPVPLDLPVKLVATLSYISDSGGSFNVEDGRGGFAARSVWSSGMPALNQFHGMNLSTAGVDIVSFHIYNFDAAVAGALGFPPGFGVFVYMEQVDLLQAFSLDPKDLTGHAHLLLHFDDDSNAFSGEVSLDGGATTQSIFGPVPVPWNGGAYWFLGGEIWGLDDGAESRRDRLMLYLRTILGVL